jgi:hypothetical protein
MKVQHGGRGLAIVFGLAQGLLGQEGRKQAEIAATAGR